MIVIHAKPGTHPGCYMRVKGARQKPWAGQVILCRRSDKDGKFAQAGEKWSRWRITDIQGDAFSEHLYLLDAA
jgi:hypothetical protein